MGLVESQQRPRIAGQGAKRVVEAVAWKQQAGVGHRRLGEHDRDIARFEGGAERVHVVERDHLGLPADRSGKAPGLGYDPLVLEDDERGVELAVVLAVEDEHGLATGHLPRQADHLDVRLRRRRGELPLRHPVASGEMLGDGDRILARQQELIAALDPPRDGLDHRRAAHGRRSRTCRRCTCPGIDVRRRRRSRRLDPRPPTPAGVRRGHPSRTSERRAASTRGPAPAARATAVARRGNARSRPRRAPSPGPGRHPTDLRRPPSGRPARFSPRGPGARPPSSAPASRGGRRRRLISVSQIQVVRPRWRGRASAWTVPALIGRRKLAWFDWPIASIPSPLTAS